MDFNNQANIRNLISRYFHERLNYRQIVTVLREQHGILLSIRHLYRLLRSEGLQRRSYSDPSSVIDFVQNELQHSGQQHGYRIMRERCLANGLYVRSGDIATILRIMDPEGVQHRTARRFNRRTYSAAGPSFLWHIDGYDKLKPYGLCIHGCICGFSRKILWLNVFNTNNNPRVIAGYFLETVEKYGGTAKVIRGDLGTENTLVKELQRWFKRDSGDNIDYIEGASTLNQRIESWWGYLRRQHIQYWIDLFRGLQEVGEYSGSQLDKHLVQFCFMGIVQTELDLAVSMWNNHTIRRSRSNNPCGQPNRMFNYPSLWNARNYMFPVPQQDVFACSNRVQFRSSVCCDADVYELCINIMAEDDLLPPANAEDALSLYRHLRAGINAGFHFWVEGFRKYYAQEYTPVTIWNIL